jgi:hypothetical protein
MISADQAREMLHFLTLNHQIVSRNVDLEMMPDKLEDLAAQNAPVRPFWIATSLARQGFFISAWSLWEFYSHGFCESLPVKPNGPGNCVERVRLSLEANGRRFPDHSWFAGAYALRNLITHHFGRVAAARAQEHFARACGAFPDLRLYEVDRCQYVLLEHTHIAELHVRIEDFLDDTA